MRIDVLTIFPNMFTGFLTESILKRAIESKKVEINIIDFREFSTNKHKKVDDTPFGGGAGMVLGIQPVYDALISIENYEKAHKILMSPQGNTLSQNKAYSLSNESHLIIMCGHYEGYDERIRPLFDEEISIGDYVLTGGELGAMVIIDSATRVLKDVIGSDESHLNDSFSNGLLEHPHYTRPRDFMGQKVPEVLVSGDHKKIEEYRYSESLQRTKERRPDLYNAYISKNKEKK